MPIAKQFSVRSHISASIKNTWIIAKHGKIPSLAAAVRSNRYVHNFKIGLNDAANSGVISPRQRGVTICLQTTRIRIGRRVERANKSA